MFKELIMGLSDGRRGGGGEAGLLPISNFKGYQKEIFADSQGFLVLYTLVQVNAIFKPEISPQNNTKHTLKVS